MATAGTSDGGVSFEEAIAKTGGHGWFQNRLLLMTLSIGLTFSIGVSSVSYVMPAITCEFKISKYHQGLIYSAIYLGMVPFGAVWGAASDIFGRRITLIITCGIAGTFELLSGFSTSYWMLFACKFLAGCAVSGVHLTYYVYLSEFVDAKNKDAMTILTGAAAAFGYFIQPAVGTVLLPLNFKIPIMADTLIFKSWNLFLVLSALAPIISFFVSVFLITETPKFLLMRNRKEESLQILQKIYSTNTKQPKDTYPVKNLSIEEPTESKDDASSRKSGSGFINYVKPLFQYPYFIPAMMAFAAQFITMGSYNTVRQHVPTLFALALGIGQKSNATQIYSNPQDVQFCVLFKSQDLFSSKPQCDPDEIHLDYKLFFSSTIVGFVILVSFFVFKVAVVRFGKVRTFLFAHLLSATVMSFFPYSTAVLAVTIITIYSLCMQNSLTIALGLMIGRVPASMRGLTVSLIMVIGRIGVILGNQVLPVLTSISCHAGFWTIACINLMAVPIMFVYSRQPNPYEDASMAISEKKSET